MIINSKFKIMKIKLLMLIIIALSWSCSSNSEKSTNESAPYEEYKNEEESPSSYTYDEEVQAVNEQERSLQKSKDISSEATAEKTTSYFNKTENGSSDTLYLKSVRLSKKFIKTANLRFKVDNVEKTTHTIEQLALKTGGYIHQSSIQSTTLRTKEIEKSADSIIEIVEYKIENRMIIRVPDIYFDSILSEVAKLHVYLNHREVKTEDVSTTFLRNKLKEEKRTEYEKRIQKAVDKAPRKLDDIVMAERQASELADIAIDKKIDNYQLQDRMDFSTIELNFYQSNSIYQEIVENTRLAEYQPNFWQKAWKALQVGWKIILEIIIGLLYLWPLYLLAIGVYYLVRLIKGRMKK